MSVSLALLRHGPTDWSAGKRLQGRTDRPLSASGREEVSQWRLPKHLREGRVISSPLLRTRETAELLGLSPEIEPRLVEASWGLWEGERLAELRARDPEGVAAREAAGLDFHPPGGESARQVQERLTPLLAEIVAEGEPVLAVTHRGVIRALLALTTGWTMTEKPPVKLRDGHWHEVLLSADGVTLGEVNQPL